MTRRSAAILTLLLAAVVFHSPAMSQVFPVTPIQVNGDPADKVNIVFLGDGYTAAEMSLYISDVQSATTGLFLSAPYYGYEPFFNVYAIEVPSAESGTDHPYTASDCPGGLSTFFANTYFNCTFDYANIHRLLVVQNSSAVYSVLGANFPNWDVVFVVVNHSYYGGSGGAFATFSTHTSATEIAIHELGHSFADLGDEYDYGGTPGYETPNTTAQTTRSLIKWNDWIDASTPVPTPESGQYGAVVGLFEGAVYNPVGWYRPKLNCKMKALGYAFCEVCKEQTVRSIYNLVPVILGHDPPEPAVAMYVGQSRDFSVTVTPPVNNTVETTWYVDGSPVASGSESHSFVAADYGHGTYALQAVSRDTTALVRTDPGGLLESEYTWAVSVDTVTTSAGPILFARARLEQNVPNPFNPSTSIAYSLPHEGHVTLSVFDTKGRLVRTLVDGVRSPGVVHGVAWNGEDDAGRRVASGIYFYRLIHGNAVEVKKMLLLK
jgi:hypothetical protein